MNWEAGLVNKMETLAVYFSLMSAYYSGGRDMGKFAQNHNKAQVDAVLGVLDMLNEEEQ